LPHAALRLAITIEARKSSTPAEDAMTGDVNSPVAILDKELAKYPSYTIETFEPCDCCGARFAIGYNQACKTHALSARHSNDLPKKLREMLAEDHGHERKHKHFTEIWVLSNWGAAVD
jgi:hypothetical protein